MRDYECFYRGARASVQANSSLEAQKKAAVIFKARRSYEVVVVLADVPVNTGSL